MCIQLQYLVQNHMAMQKEYQQAGMTIHDRPSTINFVESAPSMLREIPWIQLKDYKVATCDLWKFNVAHIYKANQ